MGRHDEEECVKCLEHVSWFIWHKYKKREIYFYFYFAAEILIIDPIIITYLVLINTLELVEKILSYYLHFLAFLLLVVTYQLSMYQPNKYE